MKLPDEQIIEGDIGDAITRYIAEKKPLGIFFMGICGDRKFIKPPDVIMSATIRMDWLADQLEELAKLYRQTKTVG